MEFLFSRYNGDGKYFTSVFHPILFTLNTDHMNTLSKIVIGITALMAGVGIGMLIAPDTGVETQSKIKNNAQAILKRLIASAQRKGEEVIDRVDDVTDKAKAKVNQAKGYLKAESNHIKGKLEGAV